MVWSKMKILDAPVLSGLSKLRIFTYKTLKVRSNLHIFQQLLGLGVVDGFDMRVI